jgi:hypothetical protein
VNLFTHIHLFLSNFLLSFIHLVNCPFISEIIFHIRTITVRVKQGGVFSLLQYSIVGKKALFYMYSHLYQYKDRLRFFKPARPEAPVSVGI